jgi:predicted ArsR family transcriptional regulator
VDRDERLRRDNPRTSGRIVELLRKRAMTIDELAAELGVTRTAIRSHLANHLRDGTVEEHGTRRGASKPARVYGLTGAAQLRLSRAYVPLLTQLLQVLSARLGTAELDELMQEVGRGLAPRRVGPRAPLAERVEQARELLASFGALTDVTEAEGQFTILGHGCPLAAVTANHAEACTALEALLAEFVDAPVKARCERYERRRCCFELGAAAAV